MAERQKKTTGRKGQEVSSSGGRSPVALGLIGVAVVAALVVGWNLLSTATDQTARTPVAIEDTSAENLLRLAIPVERGSPDTPIILMDFSDYSCPACRQFAAQVKPLLDDPYVTQGIIRFQYFDFVTRLFPNSFVAARAARCAGDQEQYWPFHDQLYRNQDSWSRQADPVPTFEDFAAQLGLDRGEFRSCLRSDRHAETVTANTLLGQQLGVSGTPTVFLNTGEGRARRIDQWSNAPQIMALIDEAAERLGVRRPGMEPEAGAEPGDREEDPGS